MRKNIKYLTPCLWLLTAALLIMGCRKNEDLTARVEKMNFMGDIYKIDGPIDQWLYDKFTVPYNIKVQYKWDRSKVDLSKSITPIDESKVIMVAEKLLTYYIDPYREEAGELFVKKFPPKEYLLVGSAEYNTSGTVTLGSAHAGRKVTLYRLNEIDESNWAAVQRMLKTVHHEFAHILDQTRAVSPEFGAVSKADYVEDAWTSYSEQSGLDLGFISPYARSEKGEDFAETVAFLLVYGQTHFDNLVASAAPAGQVKLRQKEKMVVDYFKLTWDIDFRSLQQRITDLMPAPVEPVLPPLLESFGDGMQYGAIKIDDNTIQKESEELWNEIKTEMVDGTDRHIGYIRFSLLPSGQLFVRIYRYAAGAGESGSLAYSRVYFNAHENANGSFYFTYSATGDDGSSSSSAVKPYTTKFNDFIESNDFVWAWLNSNLAEGGLYVVDAEGKKTGLSLIGGMEN